jgi:hypothetical protein
VIFYPCFGHILRNIRIVSIYEDSRFGYIVGEKIVRPECAVLVCPGLVSVVWFVPGIQAMNEAETKEQHNKVSFVVEFIS